MKKDIHPGYNDLKIKIGTDDFITRSTFNPREKNKSGEIMMNEILMDVDFRKHPAWNKSAVNVVNQSNKNVSDFNKKFGGLSFGIKK